MRTDFLEEYVVCANLLSVKNAAANLHMAQSNLSKHMKQLEEEVQFKPFTHRGNKVTLTQAGSHFLVGVEGILDAYESLKESCKTLQSSQNQDETQRLTIQQHSYVDEGVECYYRFINGVHKAYPHLIINFAKASRRSFQEELKSSHIDLCLGYRCGSVEQILQDYANEGLFTKHLCSEPLAIWCHKSSALAEKNPASVADLNGIPIMAPCDASAVMKPVTKWLCRENGFEPTFLSVASTSQPEFLNSYLTHTVYIYPYSFTQTHLLKGYDDMVAIPFGEEVPPVHTFAVSCRNENPFTEALEEFMTTYNK